MVREQYLALHGELPERGDLSLNELTFPGFVGSCAGGDEKWRALARVTCGEFTDVEWATASAPPNVSVHGLDLACHYPKSWIA
jgi:hypothetical protein